MAIYLAFTGVSKYYRGRGSAAANIAHAEVQMTYTLPIH